MRWMLFIVLIIGGGAFYYLATKPNVITPVKMPAPVSTVGKRSVSANKTKQYAQLAEMFAKRKGFSTDVFFLIDMSQPSGQNRFYVYQPQKHSVELSGLVAHGSCNTKFLETPQFSNQSGCGCSSLGKYKVGGMYDGRFGKAFKLFGLDSSNSHAYERNIVLHSYYAVPDIESSYPICNSLGCPMVSLRFFDKLASVIKQSKKPILLWIYQ